MGLEDVVKRLDCLWDSIEFNPQLERPYEEMVHIAMDNAHFEKLGFLRPVFRAELSHYSLLFYKRANIRILEIFNRNMGRGIYVAADGIGISETGTYFFENGRINFDWINRYITYQAT